MGATKEGNLKGRETQIEKYGSIEAYKEHMADIAAKGGKRQVPKGLSFTRQHIPQKKKATNE